MPTSPTTLHKAVLRASDEDHLPVRPMSDGAGVGMPAGAPSPPWADLEPGLVSGIAACCSLGDYASCRAVCGAWRSALPPPLSRAFAVLPADDAAGLPVSLAACAPHARRWSRVLRCAPLLRRPASRIAPAVAARGCRCVGASRDGWLALVAGDAAAPAGPLLLNPFTGEEIPLDESLYQPAHERSPKIVFSRNPARGDFTAASLCRPGTIAVQRASDGCSYCEDTGPLLDGVTLVDVAYCDDAKAVYCLAADGQLHVIRLSRRHRVNRRMPPMEVGTLPRLPIGADDATALFLPPYDAISECTDAKSLVLYDGELYQVWRRTAAAGADPVEDAPYGAGAGRRVHVYEGDVFVLRYDPGSCWPASCWAVAEAKDLRGNAVFVGMNGAAVVRGGEGVSANSVYYWDGPRGGEYEPVVYNVATGGSVRWPAASTGGVSSPVWYFLPPPAAGVGQRVEAETTTTTGVEGAASGKEEESAEHEMEENSAHCLKKTMNLLGRLDYSVVYDGPCEVSES